VLHTEYYICSGFTQFSIGLLNGRGYCENAESDVLPRKGLNRVAKIPVELADEVAKILEKKLLGYRSRAEFVAEAVRDKLIQVKK